MTQSPGPFISVLAILHAASDWRLVVVEKGMRLAEVGVKFSLFAAGNPRRQTD